MKYLALIPLLFILPYKTNAQDIQESDLGAISRQSVQQPLDLTFNNVMKSLKDDGFIIAKEINIGENLEKDAKEKGWSDYNINNIVGIRSAIVCSGVTANSISNFDPNMVSICPLHVTVSQLGEWTRVDFIKPSVIAHGSPAELVALKLEERLKIAIHKAFENHEITKQ